MKRRIVAGLVWLAVAPAFAQQSSQTAPQNPPPAKQTVVQAAKTDKSKLKLGTLYYVSADRLNVRTSTKTESSDNVIGTLVRNDTVEIVNVLDNGTVLVQVKILKATELNTARTELFVNGDYLQLEKSLPSEGNIDANKPSKYFIIQNIATEKTRVYERCTTSPGCPHKMIFETDMVVGRPEIGTKEDGPNAFKTWVGHGVIKQWIKFYEDGQLHYPAWYHERFNYVDKDPKIPFDHIPRTKLDSGWVGSGKDWLDKKYLTNKDGEVIGQMRGAFGWYAAKLFPEEAVNYQWIHGTIGWGSDGDQAIQLTRGTLINMFSNPGSSGCTRLENRAIAFLRSFLEPGTHIYRVYAREAMSEAPKMSGGFFGVKKRIDELPKGKWNYILTKNGAQQAGGETADASVLLQKALDPLSILEKGTFEYDRTPDAVGRNYNAAASSGLSGDRYELHKSGLPVGEAYDPFYGYFLVDVGQLDGYAHPPTDDDRVHVGGLDDFKKSVPEFLTWKGSADYFIPETSWKQDNGGNR